MHEIAKLTLDQRMALLGAEDNVEDDGVERLRHEYVCIYLYL